MGLSIRVLLMDQDGIFADEQVKALFMPGIAGEFGIMHNHVPYVTHLVSGLIRLEGYDGAVKHFAIDDGIVSFKDNTAKVVSNEYRPQTMYN